MTSSARGRPLTSLNSFIDQVEELVPHDDEQLFFRGHSNRDKYLIKPSVFRSVKGLDVEHVLFRELIATNPASFQDDSSTLERLARMQHHSCPTRLLDITSNPLVALYFACKNSLDAHGEVIVLKVDKDAIKFFDSDTVSCIANLARLPRVDKETLAELPAIGFNENEVTKRLLHFIREEKPYFEAKIVPGDLKRAVVVRPKLNSKRILAQSGAFLIFGQVECMDKNPIEGVNIERISIDKGSKEKIIKSLDALGFNEGSLYLDIDSYAKYLKERYKL